MAVTLLGLDLTMNPATARQLVADGHIRALPEERILFLIKTEAKAIYEQQKLTPFFHARVGPKRPPNSVSQGANFSRSVTAGTPLPTLSVLYTSKRPHKRLTTAL